MDKINHVFLKQETTKKVFSAFIVLPFTEEDRNYLTEKMVLPDEYVKYLKEQTLIRSTSEITGVIYCGNLNKATNIKELVGSFQQRKVDIREGRGIFYRDYGYTRERQMQSIPIVNMASTPEASWRTVVRKIGDNGIVLLLERKRKNNENGIDNSVQEG